MAKGPRYNLAFRRRFKGRTDYGKRRRLVSSGMLRLVVRPSNKHMTTQLVEARPTGDHVVASAHSSELKEYGWKGSCGNMPAAYLTGLLVGTRARMKGLNEAVLDIGLHARGAGSKIFAATKGALDGGLTIPHGKETMPDQDRIQGKHVITYSKNMAAEQEAYKKRFAGYLKRKLKPEDLLDHFNEVQAKIAATGSEAKG